jgi:spore germination cell wall hydrolase CwlJ-like protein
MDVSLPVLALLATLGNPEDAKQTKCMAEAIYFEARSQSTIGQLAVGNVIINRVKSDRFPNTICKVIHQGPRHKSGHPVKHKCQFSYWCDGIKEKYTDKRAYADALNVAVMINKGVRIDSLKNSLFYHAIYTSPFWAKKKTIVAWIDDHVFYSD